MSLYIPLKTFQATTSAAFEWRREVSRPEGNEESITHPEQLTDEELADLLQAAEVSKDGRTVRALKAVVASRAGGQDLKVPSFGAFLPLLKDYLARDLIDGWVYVLDDDGMYYPHLVQGAHFVENERGRGRRTDVQVILTTFAYTMDWGHGEAARMKTKRFQHTFVPSEVTNRTVSEVLAAAGIYKETKELKAEYEAACARHRDVVLPGFAKQYRFTGKVYAFKSANGRRMGTPMTGRKVIHDLAPEDCASQDNLFDTTDLKPDGAVSRVPTHLLVSVFDLRAQEHYWVNSGFLAKYEYDKSLGTKLVLPETHRDLLDILTTDLDAFSEDIVEGKSTGNIILCKGLPGVGKTLTAEAYAELTETALFPVHAGALGTSAAAIEQKLKEIFGLAKRWKPITLLLDEADVFVRERGDDLEQNAIVAVFLRALEYHDSLMFLTTNRHDIDEAFLNRCLAILDYEVPTRENAKLIWQVMATNFRTTLKPELIDELLDLLPGIRGRDINKLLKLTLKVAHKRNAPLTIEMFRQCSMFRGFKMVSAEAGSVQGGDAPQ